MTDYAEDWLAYDKIERAVMAQSYQPPRVQALAERCAKDFDHGPSYDSIVALAGLRFAPIGAVSVDSRGRVTCDKT